LLFHTPKLGNTSLACIKQEQGFKEKVEITAELLIAKNEEINK
jgi:hypothetical protein